MKITFRCPPELEGLLPRPVPARRGLPDWLKAMPMTAPLEPGGGEIRTLKHCPPFLDAMSQGFLFPLTADVHVEGGRFSWDWDPPAGAAGSASRAPLALHFKAQATGSPLHDPEQAILKFNNFWTVGLPEGWSLLVTHPLNRDELPFRTLTGLVDADLYRDGLIQFPARWLDRGFEGLLPAGTPVAQAIPLPRESLELAFEPLEGERRQRFLAVQEAVAREPGVYRERFRAAKR